jgi:hypothetical protein
MDLSQRTFLFLPPVCITGAELRVAVTAIRILLGLFLPEQLLGQAFFLQLHMNVCPCRLLVFRGRSGNRYEKEVIPTKAPRTQLDNLSEIKNLHQAFGKMLPENIKPNSTLSDSFTGHLRSSGV